MDQLSADEVASRSGVSIDFVERLVEFGILAPADRERAFSRGDINRTRLAHACQEAGLPLQEIARAVREGKFSFGFLDLPHYEWSSLAPKTGRDIANETGLSLDFLAALRQAQGFARPPPDEPMREDEISLLPVLQRALEASVADEADVIRILRVYSDALRRIAEAETHLFHSNVELRALQSGMSERQLTDLAATLSAEFIPLIDQTILTLYRRQRERAWIEDLVGHIERAVEEAGYRRPLGRPPAMCFLDMAGYTRLTEEMGDRAAADLAAKLVGFVEHESLERGGQPVKWLGDGVMFYFKDPAAAVDAALEMVATSPQVGLPPSHAGVAAGPVIFQDGDYFGRTVNMASRIAARADPGQVLVSEEVVEAVERGDGIRFEEFGPVELKGLMKPVSLFEARR
ncbi:MAG TPA: adenylate cyclase regulatory domain-containing protein [Actinomycetota bacterium]|nr:adenylate cyclase regulatory domain-containing protein [Actinomycetota bacterium]